MIHVLEQAHWKCNVGTLQTVDTAILHCGEAERVKIGWATKTVLGPHTAYSSLLDIAFKIGAF
jgi:hypothetical protein